MNSSPFEIFRRNLKPLMVLLTGLALFAFVVLPVVDSYMRRNAGSGGERVVAKFDGKSLTQNRVDYFTRNHNETVGFLTKLAQATIERGGVPRTAGFQYDPQSKRVIRLGINESPGEEVSIRTLMFAAEANKEGFELDDNAIQSWLDRFTDGMVSDTDITAMLMSTTQNRMGRPHLYEQLRSHLLADVYLKRGYAGLYSGDNPSAGALLTPAEQWSAFEKLNRSATVDAYGVLVNDYLDQTDETPPQELILATYEEGKDRDVSDQSPDPAFHHRYTASFEYLEGDLKKFLDEEVAKLKEEDIRAEYDKQVAGGAFQLPDEMSPDEKLDEILTEPGENAAETAEKAVIEEPKSDIEGAGEESEGESKATEEVKSDEPAESNPEASNGEPATEEPAAEEPAAEEPAAEEPAAEEPAAEEPAAEEPAAEPSEDQQGSIAPSRSVRLVALQDEENGKGAETDADDSAKEETGDKNSDESVAEDQPADAPNPSAEVDSADPKNEAAEANEAAEDEQEEMKEEESKATDSGDQPSVPAAEDEEKDEPKEEAKPKVESYEDVRERLAEQMAFPAAQKRLNDASTRVFKEMQGYFTKKAIHESNIAVGQAGEPPTKPDLKAIADEIGFEFKSIGPYDQVSISDEPIATSMDAQTQMGNRGPNFALMMYGYALGQQVFAPQEKFTPLKTADFFDGKVYVSWKVDDREAYTPSLDEATDEVVKYLRMKEARGLAQTAADELAKQAAEQSDKPFAELIPEDKQENLKMGLGPFKWLDSTGRGVTMGNVPELDAVGNDFMAAVFEADTDQYRVAPNQPERVFYVVKPTQFEPSNDVLRQRFREPRNRAALAAIDAGIGGVLGGFYESIDKKAGFTDLTVTEQ